MSNSPIIYESTETLFKSNGLGRLRDCISCKVTEERNGIYECDFEYPVDGENYDLIRCGRIVAVTHDESGEIQPFDIVSYSKPISGVVSFHAVHISYRQSFMVTSGTGINSLPAAFSMLAAATPDNPFTYETDITSTAFMAAADGIPRSVRQMLGGVEGSILDSYGGEYEFDKFRVILHGRRGQTRDFAIRYGVNLLDFKDDVNYSGVFSSCVPFWKGNVNGTDIVVKAGRVDSQSATYNGRNDCVPLDLSDKFQDKPTTAQLEQEALSVMTSRQSTIPAQTISVDFVRLQDMGFEGFSDLLQCNLCDTIKVVFPMYGTEGYFKIVKTEWDALEGRYTKMELGELSTTLAEALGITSAAETLNSINDLTVNDLTATGNVNAGSYSLGGTAIKGQVIDSGTHTESGVTWYYIKYASGILEAWNQYSGAIAITTAVGQLYQNAANIERSIPSGLGFVSVKHADVEIESSSYSVWPVIYAHSASSIIFRAMSALSRANATYPISVRIVGTWK